MSSETSNILPAIQSRLHKTINSRTHGVIDYIYAGMFLTLGFIFVKTNKRASAASFTTGTLVLVQSLLTDYPLGVKPIIPFHTHGQIDGVFASTAWALPFLFGFSKTPQAKIFTNSSLLEGAVVALTDFSTEHARAEKAMDKILN